MLLEIIFSVPVLLSWFFENMNGFWMLSASSFFLNLLRRSCDFYFVDMVNHVVWFMNVELSWHLWNKLQFIMAWNLFNVLFDPLNIYSYIFNICSLLIYSHLGPFNTCILLIYMRIIFIILSCNILSLRCLWFCYQGNFGLVK